MISGNGWGLSFPDICLTVEEIPGKTSTRKTDPAVVSNPSPLDEKQRYYPSTTATSNFNAKTAIGGAVISVHDQRLEVLSLMRSETIRRR